MMKKTKTGFSINKNERLLIDLAVIEITHLKDACKFKAEFEKRVRAKLRELCKTFYEIAYYHGSVSASIEKHKKGGKE